MTNSEFKLGKAISMINIAYADANKDFTIKKPMAYALYHVWKYFDEHEKPLHIDKDRRKEDE